MCWFVLLRRYCFKKWRVLFKNGGFVDRPRCTLLEFQCFKMAFSKKKIELQASVVVVITLYCLANPAFLSLLIWVTYSENWLTGIGLGLSSVSITAALPYIGSPVAPTGSPGKKQRNREAAWLSGQCAGLEIWRSRVQVPLWPIAGFVPGSPWLNSSAALVHSQLVCLLPVGILNLLSLFQKWSACELA